MKVGKGIRSTPQGFQVYAERHGVYRSKRFPAETDILTLKRERETLVASLVLNIQPDDSQPFEADAEDYLSLVSQMVVGQFEVLYAFDA